MIQNLTHATGWEQPIRVCFRSKQPHPKDSQVFDNKVKTILFSRSNQTIEKENGIFEYLDLNKYSNPNNRIPLSTSDSNDNYRR
jgi:hypothetical protein